MNSKMWIRKALTLCMMVALVATYSMVALASTGKAVGEIMVTGNDSGGEAPFVIVNGETARSGRTIFSASTISTQEEFGAIVNMGKAGKLELAPNTTLALSFDDASISGELTSGSLTVLNAAQNVNIKTLAGNTVSLSIGETAFANAGKPFDDDYKDSTGKCVDADKDGKMECDNGKAWWVWALVFGGAAVAIAWTASNSNEANLGGGTTVVSPTR